MVEKDINKEIYRLFKFGIENKTEISKRYNISKLRVSQIIEKMTEDEYRTEKFKEKKQKLIDIYLRRKTKEQHPV